MNINKIITAGAIMAGIVAVIFLLGSAKPTQAVTDRTDYSAGEAVEITIENDTGKKVCFSSCYPYYLERQTNDWEPYSYDSCDSEEIAETCMEAAGTKRFRLKLDDVKPGLHRLRIPVCSGCDAGDKFGSDTTLYSNTFGIK